MNFVVFEQTLNDYKRHDFHENKSQNIDTELLFSHKISINYGIFSAITSQPVLQCLNSVIDYYFDFFCNNKLLS
jgi:hypothetical protein